MAHPHHGDTPQSAAPAGPRVIAWELTRRCSLRCRHCRGAATDQAYEGEFSTEECLKVIDSIASFASPILIMTGGEPMMRDDIYELAAHASAKGLRPVLAPCGHLITPETAARIKAAGIGALSISLDGADEAAHDAFRGVPGAWAKTLAGLSHAKDLGIPFQVNTTVTKHNVGDLPKLLAKAIELGASTFDMFFLVPTGRGSELRDLEISAEDYEKALAWVAETAKTAPIRVKTTCAPHYVRVAAEAGVRPMGKHGPVGGCMGGKGFVFISHRGILQPCGFFAVPCGDLRAADYDFRSLYENSDVFRALRDPDGYGGKCGICEYRRICGGCRARALEVTGDFLAAEPRCAYTPRAKRPGQS